MPMASLGCILKHAFAKLKSHMGRLLQVLRLGWSSGSQSCLCASKSFPSPIITVPVLCTSTSYLEELASTEKLAISLL